MGSECFSRRRILITLIETNSKDLWANNWPQLALNEDAVITQTIHEDGCKLAIGGSARMTKKKAELGLRPGAAVVPS